MSALPPKADMDEHGRDADQVRCSKKIGSLEVGAVAKNANRDAGLFAVFEGVGDAGRVWRLRTDWYAKWKIMDWSGPAAAALVAAPKQKDVLHGDPAPEQHGIIPVAG